MDIIRIKNQINLSKKAYKTLKSAVSKKKLSKLEQDWVIQRFEYNIELLRKTCKIYLLYKWIDFISTPRDILKEIYKIWLTNNLETFFKLLDIRNSTSHLYSEYTSKESLKYIQKYHNEIIKIINKMEETL